MHPHVFKSNNHHFPAPRTASQHNRNPGTFRGWLRTAFQRWQRRKMIETLRGMDDHLLRDIGIDPFDIPSFVDDLTERELRMRPVSRDVALEAKWRSRRAA